MKYQPSCSLASLSGESLFGSVRDAPEVEAFGFGSFFLLRLLLGRISSSSSECIKATRFLLNFSFEISSIAKTCPNFSSVHFFHFSSFTCRNCNIFENEMITIKLSVKTGLKYVSSYLTHRVKPSFSFFLSNSRGFFGLFLPVVLGGFQDATRRS